MKFVVSLFFTIVFLQTAQVAAQSILPLFRDGSHRTGVLIPFQAKGPVNAENIQIFRIELQNSKSGNCQTLIDPFMTSNFILKCISPENQLSMRVSFYQLAETYQVNYGPIQIAALSTTGTPVAPVEPPPVTDPYRVGRELYGVHCLACHAVGAKPNRSTSQISNAINGINAMKIPALQNLSQQDRQAISNYLHNL